MQISSSYFEADTTLSYVRKVYLWLLAGMLFAGFAGYVALNVGVPVEMTIDHQTMMTPPLVAMMAKYGIFFGISMIALAFIAGLVRRVPAINILVYFALTGLTGAFAAPAILFAEASAHGGGTISAHPARDAFLLTAVAFTSLSAFVFIKKKDYSNWRSFLFTGLWVILGALVLNLFLGSRLADLAISSVAVILFSGFILFDTSRILHTSEKNDAIGDALSLYLDFLNLFVHLLNILGVRTGKN